MKGSPDWKAWVIRHARATGGDDLALHAVEELAGHLEEVYLDAIQSGQTEAQARSAAERVLKESPLGPVPRSRTRAPVSRPFRVESGGYGVAGLAGDIRFAWRQLCRAPSFAAVAILTLGVGAGAATAIFSLIDTVLLRPLPYRQPAQLVAIWDSNAEKGLAKEPISPVTFMDERNLAAVFTDAAAWWRPQVTLWRPGSEPERVSAVETSPNLFKVLGVSPQVGPGFPDAGPFYSRDGIAVISDRLWRARYGADPGIVGRPLDIKDGQYTIVGVMPPGFAFPAGVDLWLRLNWDLLKHSRGAHFMEAVARLRPGVAPAQAARELEQLSRRLGREFPFTNRGWIARPVPLLDDMLGYYRPALFALAGAVVLLLVASCLNVASLLLSRATVRAREVAVRAALGASRLRLLRQMLVESVMLAGLGTLTGGVAAVTLLKLAVASAPVAVPRLAETGVDVRLLAFALCVVAATTILFGLLPAVLAARTDPSSALKDGARTSSAARGHRWNRALVVAEVAVASAVLVGSALLVETVARRLNAPLGVVPDGVVTGSVQVPGSGYREWSEVDRFYQTLLDAIRRQPGVEAAGAANALPLATGWRLPFSIEGQLAVRTDEQPMAQFISVTAGYFETLHATLIAGRFPADTDRLDTEPVVVVNRTLARRFFAGQDAVGQRIVSRTTNIGPLGRSLASGPFRIVGVVADLHQAPLGQPAEPVVYHTARQFPFRALTIVVRGRNPADVARAARTALGGVDPTVPLSDVRTMSDLVLAHSGGPRLLMFVLAFFAAVTGVLAAVGVYGLLACVVSDRRREMAIRLALGASPGALARRVSAQGLLLASLGIVVGLAAARLSATLLKDLLFETSATDPFATACAAGILLVAAAGACVGPARRAARVAPAEGLRSET